MSFANSTYKCERISGYPAAVRHFNKTKKPRSVRWGEDERPLYNVASHHYRLVRGPLDEAGDAKYYDAVLYQTPMLRLFKQKEDGTKVVWIANHDSQTSKGFLYNVCGVSGGMTVTCDDGQRRHLPLSHYRTGDYAAPNGVTVPDKWSAVLVCRAGTVLLEQSAHRLVYTRVASEEDKERRKKFRENIAQYLDILVARRPTYHSEVSVSYDQGVNRRQNFRHYPIVTQDAFSDINERAFKFADEVATSVYSNMLAEVYAEEVEADNPKLLSEIERLSSDTWAARCAKVRGADLPLSVDAAAFRKNVAATLIRSFHLDITSGKSYLEMFPTQMPRKYWG